LADQLTSSTLGTTTTNRTYDADGNQLTEGSRSFTYDLAGRMLSTVSGSTTTRYTYDGEGARLTRATGSTVNTRYSWDKLNPLPELALERNASNALVRRYVQGPAGPVSMTTSAGAFYFHRDQLGSVTDVTSASGAAQWRYAYEPFGAQLSATKVVTSAPANQTRFTGEWD
jgi:YD repeat-containing protein